jgi:hypothetical protein
MLANYSALVDLRNWPQMELYDIMGLVALWAEKVVIISDIMGESSEILEKLGISW